MLLKGSALASFCNDFFSLLKLLRKIDWRLTGAVGIIAAMSLVTLASFSFRDTPQFADAARQLTWLIVGLGVFVFFAVLDYRIFLNYRWPVLLLYGLTFALLLITLANPAVRGAKAWIMLGPLRFQPVELAKLTLLLMWGKFFSRRHVEIGRFRNILVSFAYLVPLVAVVATQPDLGSASIIFGLWVAMIIFSEVRFKHFLLILISFALLAGVLWNGFLADYQKDRIMSFLSPNYDPLGASYNVIQSKIAIGSGGIFGKGIGRGTQVQYGFLPEAKTDFIFAGFVEEWGAAGGIVLIGLFGYVISRILRIGLLARNNFAKLFCLGAVSLFVIQLILNVGSNLGLLPVTGVTLPFFSYGGSSLVISFAVLGVVQSIFIRLERAYVQDIETTYS